MTARGRQGVLLGLLLLGSVVLAQPPPLRPVTVEWIWSGLFGEVFVVERCTVRGQQCVMTPVATLPLTERVWVDIVVVPQRDYCYRLAVRLGSDQGPYSNTVCSL